jgi:hypothetical protein
MRGRQRQAYLQRQSENLRYYQRRNALAAEKHHRATCRRLESMGIRYTQLRCCLLE